MSDKTDSKRQLIIEKATEVFAAKGFRAVTMKDIVEACEISRGGLYLYYASTEEVFRDVLANEEQEEEKGKDVYAMLDGSAAELVLWFIKEQKKAILKRKCSLLAAKYEYAFFCKANGEFKSAKKTFDTAVAVLENILERGNESGEFVCEDTASMARSIMYSVEGMKVCAASFGLSEKKVDEALLFMVQQFVEA